LQFELKLNIFQNLHLSKYTKNICTHTRMCSINSISTQHSSLPHPLVHLGNTMMFQQILASKEHQEMCFCINTYKHFPTKSRPFEWATEKGTRDDLKRNPIAICDVTAFGFMWQSSWVNFDCAHKKRQNEPNNNVVNSGSQWHTKVL
jgi:hypothetical protein